MNEQTNQFIITFENIITIYKETASILNDAEALLEEKNFSCSHGNTGGTEQSKRMDLPQRWVTPYIARYFINDNNPFKKYSMGIFFLDKSFSPIEPLIICAIFNIKKNENEDPIEKYDYWYLKEAWYTIAKGDKCEKVYDFGDCWNAESGKIFARKLLDVKGQTEIQETVERLLSL